jgi:hypothetical protein
MLQTGRSQRVQGICLNLILVSKSSFVTFGGNGAAGPAPNQLGSVPNPNNQYSATWDATYKDFDGGLSIRVLNPCTSSDDFSSPQCQWFDDPSVLAMQRRRWYSAAESLGDGTIVIIGGFQNGGTYTLYAWRSFC